jgi:transposase-like protein
MFGVKRARSTVHNWVHKAHLPTQSGRSPDHGAVDETVIWLNGEKYWLYAAVDPDTNNLRHTKLRPVTNGGLAWLFLRELRGKHEVETATFLVNDSDSLQLACRRHRLDFRYEPDRNRNSIERIFSRSKTTNWCVLK